MEWTWAEDRAPVGTDPSADPGAESEGWAAQPAARLSTLRFQHECDKSRGLGQIPSKPSSTTNHFGNYPLQPANSISPKLRFPVDQDRPVFSLRIAC